MSPRSTLIFALLAIAAGAALWWFGLREVDGADAGDESKHRLFAGLDAKQIEWIELSQADGPAVRIEKRGDGWRIVREGRTTVEEVMRNTKDEEAGAFTADAKRAEGWAE